MIKHSMTVVVALLLAVASFGDEKVTMTRVAVMEALLEVRQHAGESLVDSYVVPLVTSTCGSLRDDSDLGPFIRSASKHGDDALVVVIPQHAQDAAHVVFIRDGEPVAFSQRHAATDDPVVNIESNRTAIERKPVDKYEFTLEEGELKADDGSPIKAFRIISAQKR